MSKYHQKLYKSRRENSLCVDCGNAVMECSRCHDCKEKQNARSKRLYEKREKLHLCFKCGKNERNGTYCFGCIEKIKKIKKERRDRWITECKCTMCGQPRDANGIMCQKCLNKRYKKNIKLKEKVCNAYGGCCQCCGDKFLGRLTIDHIDNNGAEHRRESGILGGGRFYHFLVRNNFPPGYQTLCSSCNLCKHIHGYCPHGNEYIANKENRTNEKCIKPNESPTNKERIMYKNANSIMSINGLTAILNMPEALKGAGINHLPPYCPQQVFKVDEWHCPENWMHGSSRTSSYFVETQPEKGLWLDFNDNSSNAHDVAILISIQGVNPLTGLPTTEMRLEQYKEKCPKHNILFKQDLFCPTCNYKWSPQNYMSTTGQPSGFLWLDGFRAEDGVIRQYIFTEEEKRGVAAQIIGENRVFAIGIAFFISKSPKPKPERIYKPCSEEKTCGSPTGGGGWTYPLLGGATWQNSNHYLDGGKTYSGGPASLSTHDAESAPASYNYTTPPDAIRGATEESVMRRSRHKSKQLEIGAGAKVQQRIFADPKSLDYWEEVPHLIYINYVNQDEAKLILNEGKKDLTRGGDGFLAGLTVGSR